MPTVLGRITAEGAAGFAAAERYSSLKVVFRHLLKEERFRALAESRRQEHLAAAWG